MYRLLLTALLGAASLAGATKVLVTVVEQKTSKPVTGLTAQDFSVLDDKTPRKVEAVEPVSGLSDYMLLVDSSLVGEAVRPVAMGLIGELRDKEQMALVSYHTSADLVQDFTSSQELLSRALARIKYGNAPRALDALYAAIDGGFRSSNFRRVALLLTTGFEGPSRVTEREVVRLARRNGVSIYAVFVTGSSRSLFESLARQTGGACFPLRDLKTPKPAPLIFEAVRSAYTLTLSGNLALGERLKIDLRRPGRYFVSALPLD